MTKNALIIVDVQNDFIEGGTLAVTGGEEIAKTLASYIDKEASKYSEIVTTQDWHINPGSHWAENPDYVNTWPIHCSAETFGAKLHKVLQRSLKDLKPIRITKGEYEAAYSGFEGKLADDKTKTLAEILNQLGITDVDIVGLATDHCVQATALDALKANFRVRVLTAYIAGVDETRSVQALTMLKEAGAAIV